MRKIFLFTLSLFFISVAFTQLKSPDEFLGYELGTKFTPHYKIVNYFTAAIAAMPQMAKLEKYGETNEGRPLLLAIIASPENFSKIEEIRKNNLRLTGLLNDKPADVNAPAIVWLSYNVHGNEPSSSEVAMKTLYELLNPSNAQTKEWLKNVVVIIDPCLNPDGRDRYVNWYTQMEGKNPDASPDSREHNEPWPGGRVNHYNFDLNRDWCWQRYAGAFGDLIPGAGSSDSPGRFPNRRNLASLPAEEIGKRLGNGQGDRDHTFGPIRPRTARGCGTDRGR